eukprot:m.16601 g.16601  ORF g.16601 m.16601 type:complete len:326 (-) comp10998_c0_seq2:437-1414(-)
MEVDPSVAASAAGMTQPTLQAAEHLSMPGYFCVGTRLEVLWEVEPDQGDNVDESAAAGAGGAMDVGAEDQSTTTVNATRKGCYSSQCRWNGGSGCFSPTCREEQRSQEVWWKCVIVGRQGTHVLTDDETGDRLELPVFLLRYDTNESLGWAEAEETLACPIGYHRLLDLTHNSVSLFYRKEGEVWDPMEISHVINEHESHVGAAAVAPETAAQSLQPEGWERLQASTPRAAAEEIADKLMGGLVAPLQQAMNTLPADAVYRVTDQLQGLRTRFIDAITPRFASGESLSVDVAREIMEQLQLQSNRSPTRPFPTGDNRGDKRARFG